MAEGRGFCLSLMLSGGSPNLDLILEPNYMGLAAIAKKPNSTEKPQHQNSKFKHLMWLHWVMASLLILLYLTGLYVAHPPQSNFIQGLSPFLHQSIGTLLLSLLFARIFLLLRVVKAKYSRRLPKVTTHWLKTTALHTALYFFLLIVPVSGLFLRNFRGVETTFFGISVPPIFAANGYWAALAKDYHFWASYIFLGFIGLHLLAHWKLVRSPLKRCICWFSGIWCDLDLD
jgi:cytochrome b561